MGKEHEDNDLQMEAYSEAVKSGLYAKKSGLVGKYDNVRKYWEDEITRSFLYPYLCRLIERKRNRMERIRIMDLGCGSADGYELLMGIRYRDADLHDTEVDLLTPDIVGAYKGVDLNEDLLDQARSIYGHNPKVSFKKADFSTGLPMEKNEKNYDLYFTSFGTCSHHNEDESLVQLLADIAKHTDRYSLVVFDWLGRYSYEWQTLWTNDLNENRNMDYVVSYIYDKEEREERRDELQHLNLRLMSRQEIDAIVQEASKRAGVEIKQSYFFDRSIMTGRHLDTGEYNPHAQAMREAVNSLHEVNLRTDLQSLIFNYLPKEGFGFVNDFFEHLQMSWNILIQYTNALLTLYDENNQVFREPLPEVPATYPDILRSVMERMRRVIEGVGWLSTGLPRENVIEPQLGYSLRNLVMNLQRGQGFGHGLVGILEIDKEK